MNCIVEEELGGYATEQRNSASFNVDRGSSLEIAALINSEDKKIAFAVEKILPNIAALADDIVLAFKKGGRLFYMGAGSSGRLGELDAAECPPTFGVSPEQVQALTAGGPAALTGDVIAIEDSAEAGVEDLKKTGFTKDDVLVGVTASGQAPYVLGALAYARDLGAITGAISCNEHSKTFDIVRHRLYINVGPEVITGSTRMKSGTAQKLVLNMLSTISMIRMGKVYKNLMVDLNPANRKLVLRSLRIIREATGCSPEEAERAFEASGKKPKLAIVMILMGVDRDKAVELLAAADGRIGELPGLKERKE
jgi:N-acetylmuramic acid 6-phosphate etherase